jgi:tetratricopeptide (TPR) repeat protein
VSLVIAKKDGNVITIVSDTKLTYPNEIYPEYKLADPDKGVVKTVITNPFVCISFACDDIDDAEEAMRKCTLFGTNISTVLNYLFNFHNLKKNRIDFIVCLSLPNLAKIYEIKSGKKSEVSTAWIGSLEAFNCFQQKLHDNKNRLDKKASDVPDYSRCFTEVIESGIDKTVNGFTISVTNTSGIFLYTSYVAIASGLSPKTYTTKNAIRQRIGDVEGFAIALDLHGSAQEGNYTICIYGANDNYTALGLHILQGNFGVVYSTGNEKSLLYPSVYDNQDEFEFEEVLNQFKILKTFSVSSKQKSYFNRGNKSFNLRNFEKAIKFYDLGLLENETNHKGRLLLNKGIAFINLRNIPEALTQFNLAIKQQPSLQGQIQKILHDLQRKR